MAFVGGLRTSCAFKPLVDRRYPLAQLQAVFELALSGEKIGNLMQSFD